VQSIDSRLRLAHGGLFEPSLPEGVQHQERGIDEVVAYLQDYI
jgi:hypothetical protein